MEHAATHHASKFTDRQKKIALLIVALAFVMDLVDSTIVNIAIPSIQSNLGASFATIQWMVAGYSLTFALLMITGGRMGDVFGYKKMFLIGVTGFTIASLLSGIAPTAVVLVIARLLQGAMAALMVPQVMSLMQVMFKPQERNGVMGMFGMLGGLGASLGPIIGGLVLKANLFGWDWRPIFLLNLPVGIFALLAGMKFLPEGRSPHPLHLDVKGTFMIIVGLSLLVFPLIEGRDLGWPVWTLIMMAASVPALAWFGWYEARKHKRDQSALIVPSLFKVRTFLSGLVLNIILESVMIGFFLTLTLLIQIGLGYSPITAALTGLPTAIGMTVSFVLVGQKLIVKYGRNVIGIGCVVLAAGLLYVGWLVSTYGTGTSPWAFAPGLFAVGVGLATIMAPIFSAALQDVDPGHAGAASGVLNAVQQVGAAIGIAIIGVIFFGQLTNNATTSFDDAVPQLRHDLGAANIPSAQQDVIVSASRACYRDRTTENDSTVVPDSCQNPSAMDAPIAVQKAIQDSVTNAAKNANAANFAAAFRASVVYVIILLVVATGLSFTLPRKFKASHGEGMA
ncbi:MAG TPA: MFS transporter [Candidatus Saccharimonas sp.]|nr:MFS transporter [Candidatus Saccharimonas sp.]